MKPFDLKAALEGAPVITSDGAPVSRIEYFPELHDNDDLFVVVNGEGYWFENDGEKCGLADFSLHMHVPMIFHWLVLTSTHAVIAACTSEKEAQEWINKNEEHWQNLYIRQVSWEAP